MVEHNRMYKCIPLGKTRGRTSENGEFRTVYLARDRELHGLLYTTKYEECLSHKIEYTRE